MKRTIFTKFLFVSAIIMLVLIVYVSMPFTLLMGRAVLKSFGSDYYENIKPEITQGEFAVSLTYKINGETVTVSDIYLCEYLSYDSVLDKRRWGGEMQSTGKIGFVLHRNLTKEIICWIGTADYYMGDMPDLPSPYPIVAECSRFSGSSGVIGEDELYEKYGIELVSWECSPPVQNSFDDFPNTD